MDTKFIIKTVSETYRYHINYIREARCMMIDESISQVAISKRIVSHIEFVIYSMEDKYSLILQNDIIKGLYNKKYKDGCSKSTYYRYRQTAYEMFIREINK